MRNASLNNSFFATLWASLHWLKSPTSKIAKTHRILYFFLPHTHILSHTHSHSHTISFFLSFGLLISFSLSFSLSLFHFIFHFLPLFFILSLLLSLSYFLPVYVSLLIIKYSDSQSLLRWPLVVREFSWICPRILTYFNILSSADHQIFLSGPRTKKVWEPLI